MTISIKKVVPGINIDNNEILLILPENYYDKTDHRYYESSISFYKYAKDKLNIGFLESPKILLEQRSGDWFGPVIFVSSLALTNNPVLISIVAGVMANYITDFFKGKKEPNVKVKIVYKETIESKYTEIHYEGSSNGLSELSDAIKNIAGHNNNEK